MVRLFACFFACLLLIPLLFIPFASAATLHGTIYNSDLTIAKDVIIEIDTQPQQRYLSKDGDYSFQVPPGDYRLTVLYEAQGHNESMREVVNVVQEGTFTFDLFLFPDLEEEDAFFEEVTTDFAESPLELIEHKGFPWFQLIGLLFLLAFGLGGVYLIKKRKHDEQDLAEEMLALIRKEGGRISQKELRKRIPQSEAKISLLISELVAKGKLEKLKRGRGNILVLKR